MSVKKSLDDILKEKTGLHNNMGHFSITKDELKLIFGENAEEKIIEVSESHGGIRCKLYFEEEGRLYFTEPYKKDEKFRFNLPMSWDPSTYHLYEKVDDVECEKLIQNQKNAEKKLQIINELLNHKTLRLKTLLN